MSTDAQQRNNAYFIDAESGTEMARLMHQDRLTTKGMGGLIPELTDLSTIHDILDIACGPGGWVLDMAFEHPKSKVVGIDISKKTIDYASAQAHVQGLDNASFRVMDALKPLGFADDFFDLVNARLLIGFMRVAAWSTLIQEYFRILRPGGITRLTEAQSLITNSPAYEQLSAMLARAMYATGQLFAPDGPDSYIAPTLERFLREAGFQNIQQAVHTIDFSLGTEAHGSMYQNLMVGYQLVQPFLIKMGVTTQEEVEHLYREMLIEMLSDDFRGTWSLLSVYGKKPAQGRI